MTETRPVSPSPYIGSASSSGKSVINTGVRTGVQFLGAVAYDGMTLPLFSPDGRRLVTQIETPQGPAPTWDDLCAMAISPAAPPLSPIARRTLLVYELASASHGHVAQREPSLGKGIPLLLPERAHLGRSAGDAGILIERARGDAGRSIGMIPWASMSWAGMAQSSEHAGEPGAADVRWLCDQAGTVFAWATFLPARPGGPERIAASRARVENGVTGRFEIIIADLTPSGGAPVRTTFALPDFDLVCPIAGEPREDGTPWLAALALPRSAQVDQAMWVVRLTGNDAQGRVELVERVQTPPSLFAAVQAVGPMQTPWLARVGRTGVTDRTEIGVIVLDPDRARCMWIPAAQGVPARPLPPRSVVGLPVSVGGRSALMLATDRAVLTVEPGQASQGVDPANSSPWRLDRPAVVLAGAFVPRMTFSAPATGASETTMWLMSFRGNEPAEVQIWRLDPPRAMPRNSSPGSVGG